jgi:hypothetical protein
MQSPATRVFARALRTVRTARTTRVAASCALVASGVIALASACSSSSTEATPDASAPDATADVGQTVDTGTPAFDAGGSCDGPCAPVEMGTLAAPATALAIGVNDVFFEANGVFACAKGGCANGTPTTLVAAQNANDGIDTVTGGQELLYFTVGGAAGHIGRCDPGGMCNDQPVSAAIANPARLIGTGLGLFVGSDVGGASGGADAGAKDASSDASSDANAGPTLEAGAVVSVPVAGAGATPTFVAAAHRVLGFAFAGDTLVWTDDALGVSTCKPPCSAVSPAVKVSTGLHAAPSGRPAFYAGTAYWPTSEGAIVECYLMTCDASLSYFLPADPERVVGDLATDGQTLYFSIVSTTKTSGPTSASGAIAACPLDAVTCAMSALASGLASPNHLGLDGTSLYWANGSASTDGAFAPNGKPALMRLTR